MATSSLFCAEDSDMESDFVGNKSADVHSDEEFEGESDDEHMSSEENSSGKFYHQTDAHCFYKRLCLL